MLSEKPYFPTQLNPGYYFSCEARARPLLASKKSSSVVNKNFETPAPARGKTQIDMKKFKGVAGVGVILNITTKSSQFFNNTRLLGRKFI